MEINIKDYLSEDEIKDIVKDELHRQVRHLISTENSSGWTAHTIKEWMSECIIVGILGGLFETEDKAEIKKLFAQRAKELINNLSSHYFFPTDFCSPTKLTTRVGELLIEAANNNVETFNERIKKAIEDENFAEYELGQLVGGIFDKLTEMKKK
jgi:hypothetical protein